jgi:hypothetical protein
MIETHTAIETEARRRAAKLTCPHRRAGDDHQGGTTCAKVAIWFVAAISVLVCGSLQLPGAAVEQPAQAEISSRGPDDRVWTRKTITPLANGGARTNVVAFTELATGLHFLQDNQWVESRQQFELIPGAASGIWVGRCTVPLLHKHKGFPPRRYLAHLDRPEFTAPFFEAQELITLSVAPEAPRVRS